MMNLLTPYIDRPTLFAALAIVAAFVRYGSYFWALYQRTATPHVFSWFTWFLIVGIGAAAQFELGGGPSAWVLAVVAVTCLFITVLALFVGEKEITKSDWLAFVGALSAIPVWLITKNPFWAIVVLMAIDVLSYYPTLRKCWYKPHSEPVFSAFWSGLRYFLALFAIPEVTLETFIYPFFLMAGDWGFMFYLMWRRRVLNKPILAV